MKLFSKKLISLLLSCMFIFSMSIPTMAAENDTTTDGLFIITEEVPDEAIRYVQEDTACMIGDLYQLNTITIGQPFVVHGHDVDLYYFLIYSNRELVGAIRVYEAENGDYTGIFSEDTEFLDGFVDLMDITDSNTPAKIVVGEFSDMYAIVDGSVLTLLESYDGNTTSATDILQKASTAYSLNENVVNAAEGIDFEDTSKQRAITDSHFLPIGWEEIQKGNNWCAAYATASILRYVKKLPLEVCNAKIIMQYTFPSLDEDVLKERTLTRENALRYASTQHGVTATFVNKVIDYTTLKKEINADRPVYFGGDRVDGSGTGAHAFVCRGYVTENNETFYSVWNPWTPKFERVSLVTRTYAAKTGEKYKFARSIYGWKKM